MGPRAQLHLHGGEMPDGRQVSPWPMRATNTDTWLLRGDESSASKQSRTRTALIERLQHLLGVPALLLSRGWNRRFALCGMALRAFSAASRGLGDCHVRSGSTAVALGSSSSRAPSRCPMGRGSRPPRSRSPGAHPDGAASFQCPQGPATPDFLSIWVPACSLTKCGRLPCRSSGRCTRLASAPRTLGM